MNENIIIHVVDDEPGMRKALARLLRAEGYEVRLFCGADDLLAGCRANEINCLLLDISMPGLNGLELQRRLVRCGASIPIVFLTGHGDIPMTVNAVKAGAVDFLTKPVDEAVLLKAVQRALTEAAAQKNSRDDATRAASRFSRLTPREREVMDAVVSGKPNKIIAFELGTCEQTIKVHRGRVMEKMGVDSLAELIRIASRLEAARKTVPAMAS
jgi:two-component system, LuxR family, response regulator FixJ